MAKSSGEDLELQFYWGWSEPHLTHCPILIHVMLISFTHFLLSLKTTTTTNWHSSLQKQYSSNTWVSAQIQDVTHWRVTKFWSLNHGVNLFLGQLFKVPTNLINTLCNSKEVYSSYDKTLLPFISPLLLTITPALSSKTMNVPSFLLMAFLCRITTAGITVNRWQEVWSQQMTRGVKEYTPPLGLHFHFSADFFWHLGTLCFLFLSALLPSDRKPSVWSSVQSQRSVSIMMVSCISWRSSFPGHDCFKKICLEKTNNAPPKKKQQQQQP